MFQITNSCTCLVWEDGVGYDNEIPTEHCDGICWDDALSDFTEEVKALVDANDTGEWAIEGYPVWNGTVNGLFTANTPRELLDRITPSNTDWTLRYLSEDGVLKCVLYHHDAPTGGAMTITPIRES